MFGNLLFGLCFSICGAASFAVIGLLMNFPRLLQGLLALLRLFFRLSFQVYAFCFGRLRPIIFSATGIDLLLPKERTLAAALSSLLIGSGIFLWLGWDISYWWLTLFAIHGLVVGISWEQIEHPGEFRLGERLP